MAGYNTSSAYDLSVFEDAQREEPVSPKLKVVKNRRHIVSSILSPVVLCAFIIVITLISLMVYNHVQLNILTTEISKLSEELETLHSENVRMTSILDTSIAPAELKRLAAEIGMQPRSEYQTERIYLYHEDKIERSDAAPQPAAGQTAKLAVTTLFSRFKEYLAGD